MPTTEATKEDFDREVDRALASWKQLGGRATRLGRELTLCMQMVAAGSLDAAVTVQGTLFSSRNWAS